MNVENAMVQMRKGIIEFCVMHLISRGEIYTSDLIQELTRARMAVVEGTLYPLLTRLKNAGLLDYTWKESTSGPPRKYYVLTEQGRKTLLALTVAWNDTVAAVETVVAAESIAGEPMLTPDANDATPAAPADGTQSYTTPESNPNA